MWLNVTTYSLLPLIVLSRNVISCKSSKPFSARSLGNTDTSQRTNRKWAALLSKTRPDTYSAQHLTNEQSLHKCSFYLRGAIHFIQLPWNNVTIILFIIWCCRAADNRLTTMDKLMTTAFSIDNTNRINNNTIINICFRCLDALFYDRICSN